MRIDHDTSPKSAVPLLEVRGVTKQFGAVAALDGVSLSVDRGEALAILGDNGAGKSTLIKGLSGVYRFTTGEVLLDGSPMGGTSPAEARALGIETVFQTLAVFDNLKPAANFYAGREMSWPRWLGPFGLMREKEMVDSTRRSLEDLQVNIPSMSASLGVMSGGQRQAIACARAVAFASRIVILDEPTAALGLRETRRVWDLIKRVHTNGTAVILISHNMEEVFELADRAVVLRQGRVVGHARAVPENHQLLVSLIMSGTTGQRADPSHVDTKDETTGSKQPPSA